MAQLTTTYAGLTLQNPIIISSSGLTNSAAKIRCRRSRFKVCI